MSVQTLMEEIQILSVDERKQLIGLIEESFTHQASARPLTPLEIMQLPADERDQYVRHAFSLAENEDFEVFEAYEDIQDAV
jgi:hypothetical protein